MQITLTGTGTSFGMPVIACSCPRCHSKDPRDIRWRASAHIEAADGTSIIIDAGPEFRLQLLKYGIATLDGMLITHGHADHLHGLDDVRVFSHTCSSSGCESPGNGLKLYTAGHTIRDIENRFDYIFHTTQAGGGKPKLTLVDSDNYSKQNPIKIGSIECVPVPLMHGDLSVTGWLLTEKKSDDETRKTQCQTEGDSSFVHSFAYLTDCSFVPDSSIDIVKNVEYLVIDGLRVRKHATHFSFDEALECSRRINAKHTWFTHICHDLTHSEICSYIIQKTGLQPDKQGRTVEPAYDGMIINIC